MLIAVSIRAYVCARLSRSWEWNDYTCFIAARVQVGSVAHAVVYIVFQLQHPLRPIIEQTISDISTSYNSQFISISGITYLFTIFFTKLSILLLYNAIFGVNHSFRRFVLVTIAIMSLFYVPLTAVSIAFTARCNINRVLRNPFTPLAIFCNAFTGPLLYTNAAFAVITDFWLFSLPIPIIRKLHVTLRQKLGLGAVFAGGLGDCGASLARLIVIVVVANSYSVEPLLGLNTIAELSVAELNVGIIVACAPCFPLFYEHVRKSTASLRNPEKIRFSKVQTHDDIVSFHQ
ncbi:hypothetical protein GGR57DRAFT_159939 [Xylariaceae sp. FL1272]|nr:hypothetical protein GGR57DRAFT_159939 [Xylariaceae sp. FL1272]